MNTEYHEHDPGTANFPTRDAPELDVTILLPCRNEEHTVAACTHLALAWITSRGLTGEVLVVDNASTDTSATKATDAGARVVSEPRIGYGNALRTGIDVAEGQIVIMADADGTYDLTNLDAFYDPIAVTGMYDVVVGNRLSPRPSRAAMSIVNLVGNRALSALTRTVTGTPILDVHCGLRSFTRNSMTDLPTWSTGMEFATHMLTHAQHNRLHIDQTPITLHPATAGRQSHLRPIRDGLRHLAAITRESLRRRKAPAAASAA